MEREPSGLNQEEAQFQAPETGTESSSSQQIREWFRSLSPEEQQAVIEKVHGSPPVEVPQPSNEKPPLVTPVPGPTEIYHGIPQPKQEKPKASEPVARDQIWEVDGVRRRVIEVDPIEKTTVLEVTEEESQAIQTETQKSGGAGLGAGSNKKIKISDLEKLGRRIA